MNKEYLSKKTVKDLIAKHVTQWAVAQAVGEAKKPLVMYLNDVIDAAEESKNS